MAFLPDVCCWQSKGVPHFYQPLMDSLNDDLRETEEEPIVNCNSVQAYRSLDKQVRLNPTQWCFKDSPYPASRDVKTTVVGETAIECDESPIDQ